MRLSSKLFSLLAPMFDRMAPGATSTTLMPKGASSKRSASLIECTAALDALRTQLQHKATEARLHIYDTIERWLGVFRHGSTCSCAAGNNRVRDGCWWGDG